MSLFKFFKFRKKTNLQIEDNNSDINMYITYYDEQGLETKIHKSVWIEKELKPRLKNSWYDADKLYQVIIDSFSKKIFNEIKEACLRLYSIDQNYERRVNVLGILYTKLGMYNEAERNYISYFDNNENPSIKTFFNYASLLLEQNKKEEALICYRKALSLNLNLKEAFDKYFEMLEESVDEQEYFDILQELANIEGSWRAKTALALKYYKIKDKSSADYYMKKALEESGYDKEIMMIASTIYQLNKLYDDMEKNIVPFFNIENDEISTIINVLDYYRYKNNFSEGLKICKYLSSYSTNADVNIHRDKIINIEKSFIKLSKKNELKKIDKLKSMKYLQTYINERIKLSENDSDLLFSKNDAEYLTSKINGMNVISYEVITEPLWSIVLQIPNWIKNKKKKEKQVLVLPFIVGNNVNLVEDEKNFIENLSIGMPLFIFDNLYKLNDKNEFTPYFMVAKQNDELYYNTEKYKRDYFKAIVDSNNNVSNIIYGNIYKDENEVYHILESVQSEKQHYVEEDKYKVEIMMYDVKTDEEIVLVDKVYKKSKLKTIKVDIISKLNVFLDDSIFISLNDEDGNHLSNIGEMMRYFYMNNEYKYISSWGYKILLEKTIDCVSKDENNEYKKMEFIALLTEIYKYNDQLLLENKEKIYKMIDRGIFSSKKLEILLPIIYFVFDDTMEYNKAVMMLQYSNLIEDLDEYQNWLNHLVDELKTGKILIDDLYNEQNNNEKQVVDQIINDSENGYDSYDSDDSNHNENNFTNNENISTNFDNDFINNENSEITETLEENIEN